VKTKDELIKGDDPESRKKRGRPPRVDTPMEARIKAIMKGIRKPRNQLNKLMVSAFERVPDKAVMPEYHAEIKNPMAMDILKRKLKRKKYNSVDQFMIDVELMFENAKQYNEDDSQVYKDAVHLQKEARVIAQQEKEKADTEYVMEEGRIPMPNGILHNGELWKVGDWVHIQNANDLTKPIVAQIYRTWQDAEGGKWVNACWYYRPEQTVHRWDRHFLENEVVKTGQYRDHRIDEVVDRCFVMFFTRYNKGRPRDFPADKEIYVCEARYNEEKHKLNKIKTWASCLPDEVRDKDYVMDLFEAPRKLKKVPSPIAYLLKDEQTEDDELPKPEWGAENAPPKIGAVHRRPRDPKVSCQFPNFRLFRIFLLLQRWVNKYSLSLFRTLHHLSLRHPHRHRLHQPLSWRRPFLHLKRTVMASILRGIIRLRKRRPHRQCLHRHPSNTTCNPHTLPLIQRNTIRTPSLRPRMSPTQFPRLRAIKPSPRTYRSQHHKLRRPCLSMPRHGRHHRIRSLLFTKLQSGIRPHSRSRFMY